MEASEKALVRLQVLTPLSILFSLGANLVATFAIHPSLGEINDDYQTILTPRKTLIGFYWLLLYVLQIGFCVILAVARKEQTKATLVNAVGIRFVLANVCMAAWTLFWELKIFLASEICLLVAFVLMGSVYIHLLLYPADPKKRPLDLLFIHAPMRMFLVLLLVVDIWQNGLLAFRWFKYVGEQPHSPDRPGKWEGEHDKHSWIAFGVITAVGLLNAFIVFMGRDAIWACSVVFIYIALLLKGPKPAPVFIPLVLLSVLQVISLIASVLYYRYRKKKIGAIRLAEDDDDAPVFNNRSNHHSSQSHSDDFLVQGGQSAAAASGPREIEA